MQGLKILAYGIAANAFRDHFQMGESTAFLCADSLVDAICKSEELNSIFLREMTAADARRLSKLHEEQHGVPGKIKALNCMPVVWKNCPVALQGAYQGKVGCPTIVLEGVSGYHL